MNTSKQTPQPSHAQPNPSPLLVDNRALIQQLQSELPVLDLACGKGRNGLLLARKGIPVVFADRDEQALAWIDARLESESLPGMTLEIDLEASAEPLAGQRYAAALVFNYLHRPAVANLQRAVEPGGLVFYETFTVGQAQLGRPRNPDFLLRPGELGDLFCDWHILHSWEGEYDSPRRAMANLIARKPDSQAGC